MHRPSRFSRLALLVFIPLTSSMSRSFFLEGSPRLGLGLAALGRPGYINLGREEDLGREAELRTVENLRKRAWEVLDAAWEMGMLGVLLITEILLFFKWPY